MKGFKCPRVKFFGYLAHRCGHFTDLLLGVVVLPELQKVNQVVEVAVDIDFGEDADGQNHASQFTGDTFLEKTLVGGISRIVASLYLLREGGVV